MTTIARTDDADVAVPSLVEATRVWAKIGLFSFGGPAGQIALMHKELVEDRRWIGEQRFLHALNYCMLLPGPEAQQLAIYIGWLLHRTWGGIVAGALFVLPGAFVMLALSLLYVFFRQLPFVDAMFLGVKAAVLAVVVDAVLRIGRRALGNRALVTIAVAAFVAIYAFRMPFPLLIAAAAFAGWAGSRFAPRFFAPSDKRDGSVAADPGGVVDSMFARGELAHAKPSWNRFLRVLALWLPIWLGPVLLLWLLAGSASVWTELGTFFSAIAVVSFGGAYAVLAFVTQAAVENFGWLSTSEMVDGLGLAETTPGPLILVLQFVGFLAASREPGILDPIVAGALGALLTTWVTFAPCFMWIFLGAPYVEALRGNRGISAALSAITAAVVGVIMNLALWFALHVVFDDVRAVHVLGASPYVPVLSSIDWRPAVLAVAAMIAMLWFRVGMITTLVFSAFAGLVIGYWLA